MTNFSALAAPEVSFWLHPVQLVTELWSKWRLFSCNCIYTATKKMHLFRHNWTLRAMSQTPLKNTTRAASREIRLVHSSSSNCKSLCPVWKQEYLYPNYNHDPRHRPSLIWGQHGVHLGPTGPRWAPCWPHELCYLWLSTYVMTMRSLTDCTDRVVRSVDQPYHRPYTVPMVS